MYLGAIIVLMLVLPLLSVAAEAPMREIGFGNLAIRTLGVLSLFFPDFLPAAIAGGLYYGLAGIGHLARKDRNLKEQVALVSDFGIYLVLAAFVASRLLVIPTQAGIQ